MELERDRGLFFGSVHNTLNHICQVNRSILTYLDVIMPERMPLDQMVWPDRKELKTIREIQDGTLSAIGREWTEAWLAE